MANRLMPVRLAPGRLRLATRPSSGRSAPKLLDDRDCRGRRLGRGLRRHCPLGVTIITGLTANQIGRQCRQPIGAGCRRSDIRLRSVRPSMKPAASRPCRTTAVRCGRGARPPGTEESDQRHRRLLRPRRNRPGRRPPTEQCHELPPSHVGHGGSLPPGLPPLSLPPGLPVSPWGKPELF